MQIGEQPIQRSSLYDLVDQPWVNAFLIACREGKHALDELTRASPVAGLICDPAQAKQRGLRGRRKRRRPFIRLPSLCAITERLELCAQEEVGVVLQHRLTRDLPLSQLIDRFLVPSP